jgi:Na+/melibiose symporter-like transporter
MLANVVGVVLAPILYDNIGFSTSSIILGIIVFLTISVVLLIQELPDEDIQKQPRVSLKESLRISIKNRTYRIYLVNQIGMQFSFRILSAVMPFYTVSVLFLDLEDTLVMTLPYIIFAVFSFPIWGYLANKIGKKRAFIYSMAIFAFPLLLNFLFLLSPGNILIAIVMIAFVGFGTGGLWIFPPTIVGDIVDDEERRINLRRESMYYAFQEFTEKLAISIAVLLEGIVLGLFVEKTIPHPDYVGTGLDIPYYVYDPLGPIILMGVFAFIPMLIALVSFFRFPDEIIIEE